LQLRIKDRRPYASLKVPHLKVSAIDLDPLRPRKKSAKTSTIFESLQRGRKRLLFNAKWARSTSMRGIQKMARAIFIDPTIKKVWVGHIPASKRARAELIGGDLIPILRLPNGEKIFVAKDSGQKNQFTVGGSQPYSGPAVVMRYSTDYRRPIDIGTDIAMFVQLVRFDDE
jgi:hypothetical protein